MERNLSAAPSTTINWESDYAMLIDGALVRSERLIDVIDPATATVFAQAPACSLEDLHAAAAAAKRAFPGWRATDIAERRRHLSVAADLLEANAASLADLFVREQGRPKPGAEAELVQAANWIRATAVFELPVEVTEDTPKRRVEVRHEPLGAVCAILPWNAPIIQAVWKLAPALLAGNTVVLKPSPFTPLCTLKLGELWTDVFPRGVINIVSGDDQLGPTMTKHPDFAKISFTGSTATGKKVMEAASSDLKRLTLELGGNDAAIILPDVDVPKILQQLFFGAFFNTGQICSVTKRLYIHEDIYEAVRDGLHSIADSISIGNGLEAGVTLGPLQNLKQYNRVRELIDQARKSGLKLLEGKPVPDTGYFIRITLVDNPPDDSPVVTEEAFGPVLPLLSFKTLDEVVARANATSYGLAASIWSKDIDIAVDLAGRLETGTVWINQNLQGAPSTPTAGHKQSGFGVENGMLGFLAYTQPKAVFIPKPRS